jgi:hypothetical protein
MRRTPSESRHPYHRTPLLDRKEHMPANEEGERVDARARELLEPLLLKQGRDPEGFTYGEYAVALERAGQERGSGPLEVPPATWDQRLHWKALACIAYVCKEDGWDPTGLEQHEDVYMSALHFAEALLVMEDARAARDRAFEPELEAQRDRARPGCPPGAGARHAAAPSTAALARAWAWVTPPFRALPAFTSGELERPGPEPFDRPSTFGEVRLPAGGGSGRGRVFERGDVPFADAILDHDAEAGVG